MIAGMNASIKGIKRGVLRKWEQGKRELSERVKEPLLLPLVLVKISLFFRQAPPPKGTTDIIKDTPLRWVYLSRSGSKGQQSY